jgi:hypothetical protein
VSNSKRNWAKFGIGVKLIFILRHIIAYFSINIRWHSQHVSSDSRKWLIKHLFPPSSCTKQINKHNSYLLTIRFRSGIRYVRVQNFVAESVCTQWALMLTYSPLFVYKQERIIRFNQNGIIFELLTANPYMNERTPNVYLQCVGIFYYRLRVNHSWKSCLLNCLISVVSHMLCEF